MRALAIVAFVASCGFPQPTDRCDGECKLFAIDRQMASTGEQLFLEGTFEDGALVNFPGGKVQPLDMRGSRRSWVTVPPEATAGDLTITWNDHSISEPVTFRRPSFKIALQSFSTENEQTGAARLRHIQVRAGHVAVAIGPRVYQIGGQDDTTLFDSIEASFAGFDGSLGVPVPVGRLSLARAFHTAVKVGRYVYIIGGLGAGTSVERAAFDTNAELGPFSTVQSVNLTVARHHHASVVIGNYIYVIGGVDENGNDLDTLERAPIVDGELGTFEPVSDIRLMTARSAFTIALAGDKLFVIGGSHDGVPIDSVELTDVYPDAYLGSFQSGGSLKVARRDHACIVLGEDVYVLGGEGTGGTLDSVEAAPILGASTLSFTIDEPKLFAPRRAAAPVVVGNYVYLLGGYAATGGAASDVERASFLRYDSLTPFAADPTASLKIPRSRHASAVVGNTLYVIGGERDGTPLDTIEVAAIQPDGTLGSFVLSERKLLRPRSGAAVMVVNNALFVAGGNDAFGPVAEIEKLDIAPDGTLSAPALVGIDLVTPRRDFAVVIAGLRVHVIGGSPTAAADKIEHSVFDAGTTLGAFTQRTDITMAPRRGHAAAVLGRYVYLFGGFDGTSTYPMIARLHLDSGDFLDAQVEQVGAPARMRHGLTLAVIGGTIHLIGGRDNASYAAATEHAPVAFDGSLGAFSPGTTLLTPRSYATSVTIGDRLYVIGGHSQDELDVGNVEYAEIR